ncbi:hypothetical protein KY320_00495 [Candidatus Woesearchaeota archaeon]|nr:hypothetical protein [Candidatus Woesearchaeota archaeon]
MVNTTRLHVSISEPNSVRRQVLEATRSTIEMLRNFESFHDSRKQKQKAMLELRATMKEIDELHTKLLSLIPKLPYSAKRKSIQHPKQKDNETLKPQKPSHEATAHLSKLEAELKNIESRLAELG